MDDESPPGAPGSSRGPAGAVTLAELIGACAHDLALAQVQADLTTLQVGKAIIESELPARFPVPRMRIGRVEVDLKVALASSKPAPSLAEATRSSSPARGRQLVLSTPARLQGIPETHISTIRLTFEQAAYVWKNIDDRRVLLPE